MQSVLYHTATTLPFSQFLTADSNRPDHAVTPLSPSLSKISVMDLVQRQWDLARDGLTLPSRQ
jgi:hypothetical protein